MEEIELQEQSGLNEEANPTDPETAFDWENCWYPVAFVEDLPKDRPTGFTLYDEPLVLFFDGDGRLSCLRDKCAHRAARLSEGTIVEGRLECLYHGWQYDADGKCRHIPQLPDSINIPAKACARAYPVTQLKGMVWVWAGDPARADVDAIPVADCIGDPSVTHVDFQMDLPYDQSYLIENVIDVAHIHIAHHGMRGGGHRDAALPLEFDILENSITGIRSGFRSIRPGAESADSVLRGAYVEYLAPNLIRFNSEYRNPDLIAGLDLYSVPLGKSRCRLLYRKYSNFTSTRERAKPRWLEHWTQCTILEQDMSVVVGQYEEIERFDGPLGKLWMPLRTSDQLVIEYRKWLDRFGGKLPFYRGFTSSKPSAEDSFTIKAPYDRFSLHTAICGTCSKVYRNIQRATKGLWGLVAVCAAVGILASNSAVAIGSVAVAALALAAIAGLWQMKARFE